MTKRGYTEEEASEYCGMSRSYFRQSRMEGNRRNRTDAPPFVRLGRAIRYLKEDLDQWLEAHKMNLTAGSFRTQNKK